MGLREEKRERTRRGFVESAMRLFQEQGFEHTTVEQIAGEVGVSARTFFRYFEAKEAVLFEHVSMELEFLKESIMSRPYDETITQTVLAVVRQIHTEDHDYRTHLAFVRQLARESAAVEEYERRIVMPRLEGMMCDAIAARLGVHKDEDPRPKAYSITLMALLHEAKLQWLAGPEDIHMDVYAERMLSALPGLFQPWR